MIGRMNEVDDSAEESSRRITAEVGDIESHIKEINEKLADIEAERETILATISGSTFEHMSDELKDLNRQESEYARQLEELREQQNDHRRNILREESARKLLKDLQPLTEFDEVKGFYPLAVGKAQLVDYGGQTYVRYDMGGGEYFVVELARCGILNQFQYTSELWGESNLCLRPTLELLDAQNQGIINGIKNSAVIRFIAKLANSFKPKDVKEEQERLKEINLGISNTAGVFLIDQK